MSIVFVEALAAENRITPALLLALRDIDRATSRRTDVIHSVSQPGTEHEESRHEHHHHADPAPAR